MEAKLEAYIKYLGDVTNNYNRFGKVIPKQETKIDVKSFFGCDEQREKTIISKLLSDKQIKFNVVKTAGVTVNKVVEKIKEDIKEEPKELPKKEFKYKDR